MNEDEDYELYPQSNDGFVKAVFSSPERAAMLFRGHLPVEISQSVDWASLELQPSSFVKSSLQQTHSDLVFSARLNVDQGSERELRICLLFEHQTTVDLDMPLRLMEYHHELLLKHREKSGYPLPLVLPFVLHQGPGKWTVSEAFHDQFDWPTSGSEIWKSFVPVFRYLLLDLSQFDPAKQEDEAQLRVILQLMKLARTKQLLEFFRWFAAEYPVVGVAIPESLLRLSLVYALNVDDTLDVEDIAHTLENNPQLKNKTMSVAEKLIAKGRVEGQASGAWLGRIALLEEMLGREPTGAQNLKDLSIEELKRRFEALQQDYNQTFKPGRA
jgi:predicted transposase/invertase (TIGR01784 family)